MKLLARHTKQCHYMSSQFAIGIDSRSFCLLRLMMVVKGSPKIIRLTSSKAVGILYYVAFGVNNVGLERNYENQRIYTRIHVNRIILLLSTLFILTPFIHVTAKLFTVSAQMYQFGLKFDFIITEIQLN